jgi:hypothetical protein
MMKLSRERYTKLSVEAPPERGLSLFSCGISFARECKEITALGFEIIGRYAQFKAGTVI